VPEEIHSAGETEDLPVKSLRTGTSDKTEVTRKCGGRGDAFFAWKLKSEKKGWKRERIAARKPTKKEGAGVNKPLAPRQKTHRDSKMKSKRKRVTVPPQSQKKTRKKSKKEKRPKKDLTL